MDRKRKIMLAVGVVAVAASSLLTDISDWDMSLSTVKRLVSGTEWFGGPWGATNDLFRLTPVPQALVVFLLLLTVLIRKLRVVLGPVTACLALAAGVVAVMVGFDSEMRGLMSDSQFVNTGLKVYQAAEKKCTTWTVG